MTYEQERKAQQRAGVHVFWVMLVIVLCSVSIIAGYSLGRHANPEHDEPVIEREGCRYWNVLTPADEIGDNFWIGGWTKDCGDGLLQPVIEFGPDEEAVEVLSRIENYIAIRETEWNNAQPDQD